MQQGWCAELRAPASHTSVAKVEADWRTMQLPSVSQTQVKPVLLQRSTEVGVASTRGHWSSGFSAAASLKRRKKQWRSDSLLRLEHNTRQFSSL